MREGGSNSHAECRQEHQWCNQESAHNSQRVRAGFDPPSEPYAVDAGELRLGRAVVNHQQRRQLWLEAHFSGCSACQSRSSSCSFSSGTKPSGRMQLEPIRAESPGRASSIYHPVDGSAAPIRDHYLFKPVEFLAQTESEERTSAAFDVR